MKKIAIIGYGNHVRKNILPAISRIPEIEISSIHVRDPLKYTKELQGNNLPIRHLDDNIAEDTQWVYIATPIATHFELAKKYLIAAKNVICEKPLSGSIKEIKKLFDLAEENGVFLHEVQMYKFHKQYAHLKELAEKNASLIKTLNVKFTIPHLDKEDIRYRIEDGGGALLDVGYYPISLIVSLFGKPQELKYIKKSNDSYEVDLFGSAIFDYQNFYCHAEWGIGLPYSNKAILTTERKVYVYDRIFSKPDSLETYVNIEEGFDISNIKIGQDDQFANMLKAFLNNKNNFDHITETIRANTFISLLASDSEFRQE